VHANPMRREVDVAVGCWLFSLWIVGLLTCTSCIHVQNERQVQTDCIRFGAKIVNINDIEAGKKQAAVAAACNYCCD